LELLYTNLDKEKTLKHTQQLVNFTTKKTTK